MIDESAISRCFEALSPLLDERGRRRFAAAEARSAGHGEVNFKNAGREWRPQGSPEGVRVHDFCHPRTRPGGGYGVYDLAGNAGWVSVGIDHDTVAFAANGHPKLVEVDSHERSFDPVNTR